jgi:ketosteroid isomerase-like protein
LPEARRSQEESLLSVIAELDQAFSEDRGSDVADFFAEDARLMWPHMEDIVGRESIREAFVAFVSAYTTNSWSPSREIFDLCGRRAYTLGSFIEIRTPLKGVQPRRCTDVYWRFGSSHLVIDGRLFAL